MRIAFFIMSAIVLASFITVLVFSLNLFRSYRRNKKIDTSKVDKEIDRLLDITDKIYD